MKSVTLPIVLGLTLGTVIQAAPKLTFERNGAVWVAGLDGKGAKKLTEGALPQISPDGTRVAFNTQDADMKSPARHIAIADVATGKVTVLKKTPSDNCFGPAWSPDGTKLLFSIFLESDWQIALMNADGSGFSVVKKAASKNNSFYAPSWAADGKSFFCHDLESIHRCDLSGKELTSWKIENVIAHGGMNSGDRLSPSPDGKWLLMDVDMDEDHSRKNWDGPPPAVWLMNLETGKASRLSKKDFFAWDPAWIDDKEFVFISQGPKESTPSLYRGAAKSNDAKIILKNVRTPSVSR